LSSVTPAALARVQHEIDVKNGLPGIEKLEVIFGDHRIADEGDVKVGQAGLDVGDGAGERIDIVGDGSPGRLGQGLDQLHLYSFRLARRVNRHARQRRHDRLGSLDTYRRAQGQQQGK
jgi:hypothetical protein